MPRVDHLPQTAVEMHMEIPASEFAKIADKLPAHAKVVETREDGTRVVAVTQRTTIVEWRFVAVDWDDAERPYVEVTDTVEIAQMRDVLDQHRDTLIAKHGGRASLPEALRDFWYSPARPRLVKLLARERTE